MQNPVVNFQFHGTRDNSSLTITAENVDFSKVPELYQACRDMVGVVKAPSLLGYVSQVAKATGETAQASS